MRISERVPTTGIGKVAIFRGCDKDVVDEVVEWAGWCVAYRYSPTGWVRALCGLRAQDETKNLVLRKMDAIRPAVV